MSVEFLVLLVRVAAETVIWIVIANSLLSFFLPPYHPVREALERVVGSAQPDPQPDGQHRRARFQPAGSNPYS